jgi:hypothetical protein
MIEDAESAKLLAYFRLLSDDHKQEIIKKAENLISVQKTPKKETKGGTAVTMPGVDRRP